MSENDRNRLGGDSGGQGFGARGTSQDPLDNMTGGFGGPRPAYGDDLDRGGLDRTTGALGGAGGTAAATGTSRVRGNVASAVFDSHDEAQRAVAALRDAGVSDGSLSIVAQQGGKTTTTSGDGEASDDGHRSILRGILGGGALGAGLGVAALAIPGVGPLAAAGAIAASAVPEAMALGAAAGALGGSLNEVLTKHGVSDEDASYYGDRIKKGGVFVSVDTDAAGVSPDAASDILHRSGGHSASRGRMA